MKRLLLIRHAKSSWKDPDAVDIERPLNKRGKRDAPLMGQVLRDLKIRPDLIISSPAKRALSTARIIAKCLKYPSKKILVRDRVYESGLSALLKIIQELDDSLATVILLGHNPDLTELAQYLSDYPVENIPTCGVFCIDLISWLETSQHGGDFVFFDYPKRHSQ